MPYCTNCGNEVNENAAVCLNCGCAVNQRPSEPQNQIDVNDSKSFGWGCLGFMIPIVGIILFAVWKAEAPLRAKSAGIGAIIGIVFSVISVIAFYALIIVAAIFGSGAV